MNSIVRNEVLDLIKKLNLNCTIKEFEDKVDWEWVSIHQKLSGSFIKEYKDKVDWYGISFYQKLSSLQWGKIWNIVPKKYKDIIWNRLNGIDKFILLSESKGYNK